MIVLAIFAQALFAETVYRQKDANGTTSFSDQPLPQGEAIDISPAQTYSTPPINNAYAQPSEKQTTEVTSYQVHLLSPSQNQTITTDIQNIAVQASVNPALTGEDKIQFLLNGQPYGTPSAQPNTTLEALSRGEYQLKAQVVSASGAIKGESETVTFYQKRGIQKTTHP